MTDTIQPPVEPPSFEQQMISYLYSRLRQALRYSEWLPDRMPQWVPSAIRMPVPDLPGETVDLPCTTTVFGEIHVCLNSSTMVIDVLECEILAFRWNQKREAVLREQDLKSQISNLKLESPEATRCPDP